MTDALPGRDDLVAALPEWLSRQRWFAGKGRPVSATSVESGGRLESGEDSELHAVVVRVAYADGGEERYQLPLGIRRDVPHRLEYAVICHTGSPDDRAMYDAVHDPQLTGALLTRIAEERDGAGLSFSRLAGADIATGLPGRLLTVEQSNSSVVFGDTYILKLFRKVAPGINPDLEITRALALADSPHVAAPLGWIEGRLDGKVATFGLLQPFFVSATEGWALATTSVRDLYAEQDLHADEVGGDFAGESERLGAATAEVHALLAEVLPTTTAGPEQLTVLARHMEQRLDAAVEIVPTLTPFLDPLRASYDAVRGGEPVMWQRIHGDFHLGQVLRTDNGWVLLDFEGEPAKPLSERLAPDSPLRDVAGMLRSFDYAAQFLLAERPSNAALEFRATEWGERNRVAFCDGYAKAAGSDPRAQAALLRAYELDKAVYELVYEARHRPSWLPIPLGAIERLVKQ